MEGTVFLFPNVSSEIQNDEAVKSSNVEMVPPTNSSAVPLPTGKAKEPANPSQRPTFLLDADSQVSRPLNCKKFRENENFSNVSLKGIYIYIYVYIYMCVCSAFIIIIIMCLYWVIRQNLGPLKNEGRNWKN